jgi:hypothetical protein
MRATSPRCDCTVPDTSGASTGGKSRRMARGAARDDLREQLVGRRDVAATEERDPTAAIAHRDTMAFRQSSATMWFDRGAMVAKTRGCRWRTVRRIKQRRRGRPTPHAAPRSRWPTEVGSRCQHQRAPARRASAMRTGLPTRRAAAHAEARWRGTQGCSPGAGRSCLRAALLLLQLREGCVLQVPLRLLLLALAGLQSSHFVFAAIGDEEQTLQLYHVYTPWQR